MKATRKDFYSYVTIALAAAVFAFAIWAGANAAAINDDSLLPVLALCGAVASGLNGFGRRMARGRSRLQHRSKVGESAVAVPS